MINFRTQNITQMINVYKQKDIAIFLQYSLQFLHQSTLEPRFPLIVECVLQYFCTAHLYTTVQGTVQTVHN